MRLNEELTSTASRNKILEFKKWVLNIEYGTVPALAKDGEIEETWPILLCFISSNKS